VPDPKAPPPSLEALAAASGERGEPPKVINPSPGCRFLPRCPVSVADCATKTPVLLPLERQQTRNRDRDSDSESAIAVACHVAQAGADVRAFS
jgi:oligopeptide/dipeptide ABC transporter ATP-binding protein